MASIMSTLAIAAIIIAAKRPSFPSDEQDVLDTLSQLFYVR
jgi:hypothetical protein